MNSTDIMRGISLSNFTQSSVETLKDQMTEINQPYTAKNIFQQLVERIRRFENSLDQEHEVGIQLVSFGQSIQFSVLQIGYMDPSIIWFEGLLPDESPVELVQHISEISFLMMALQRQNSEKPKYQIGFSQDQDHLSKSTKPNTALKQEQESAATTD